MMPLLSLLSVLFAADAAPAAPPPPLDGNAMIEKYLAAEVAKVRDSALAEVKSLDDWKVKRPTLHRQFLEMMSLWPMPEKTPLNAVIVGTLDRPKFTVERLHFQSRPGLYVTANLYLPKDLNAPAPAILYVCGHGRNLVGGVKATYQRHGIWFASNGYVCLIIDTNELGELGRGDEHHGTHHLGKWWWHATGYTPGAVETWNAIRALDYLETRKEVDPKRFAVTGRSGGGAMSWALAAIDERIRAAVPVAGITDMKSHVADKLVNGHCDCMYFTNTYQWDFATEAALIAPRPLMLGNSDVDKIFPVDGYRAVFAGARRIYDLYGAADKLAINETQGPHTDTKALREPAFAWMNRWLMEKPGAVDEGDLEAQKFPDADLRVFPADKPPADMINRSIDEPWVKTPPPPALKTKEEWEKWRTETLAVLKDQVFRAFSAKPPALDIKTTEISADADIAEKSKVFDVRFTSEDNIRLRGLLFRPMAETKDLPFQAALVVLAESESLDSLPQEMKDGLARGIPFPFLFVEARGIGTSAWDPKNDTAVRRRAVLLGRTVGGMRVWDALRGAEALRELVPGSAGKTVVSGNRDAAVVAAFATALDEKLAGVQLVDPPHLPHESPAMLNSLRHFGFPEAVGLLASRIVELRTADAGAFDWAKGVFGIVGGRLEVFPAPRK